MNDVIVKLNSSAVRSLLRSDEVLADLEERATRIADTAGDGHEVEAAKGSTRARAIVVTATVEAMLSEAQDRTLTRSLDAGR